MATPKKRTICVNVTEESYQKLTQHGSQSRGLGHKIDELMMFEGLCIMCQSEEIKQLLKERREREKAITRG